MPTLTIDGKQVTVPEGTTVIQAAESMGIFIPRYCYHPGLSIAGNCRICLVEVEKTPKLQIACNTPVSEGMAVRTQSEKVAQAQQAVLEFLLINHPLDCPVCDQSGECDLQNFYMQYGRYDPRFREEKVKKVKAAPIGPHVMLDTERCILCSRCERFTDEVSKTGEFGIFNRGDRAEIGLYPGKALDNRYSGNVVDICPVGALTDREFRFKARVWYLSTAPSVCNGCAQGCNIDVHYVLDRPHLADGARVMRLKPRHNEAVNRWWMCDEGRYGYKFMDQGRLRRVRERQRESSWESALTTLAEALSNARRDGATGGSSGAASPKLLSREVPQRGASASGSRAAGSVAVLASAQLPTEELFLIRKLFKETLGVSLCSASVPQEPGYEDGFLIRADKNPNTAGATLLGLCGSSFDSAAHGDTNQFVSPAEGERPAQDERCDATQTIERCLAGQVKILWVFSHDLVRIFGEEKVRRVSQSVETLVFQGPNENGTSRLAHWALPAAVHVEKDGTFVNCQGRVQRVGRVLPPLQESRPEWEVLMELGRRLGLDWRWTSPEEIFAAMAQEIPAFAGMTYEQIGWQGMQVSLGHPRESEDQKGGFPPSRE